MKKAIFDKIPESDLECPSYQEILSRQLLEMKGQLLNQVVETFLGRGYNQGDIEHFSITRIEGKGEREFISYKDEIIGEIVLIQKTDEETFALKMGFEFIPASQLPEVIKLK
jgi:hypothetical protein